MKNKALILIVAICLTFALAGCSRGKVTPTEETQSPTAGATANGDAGMNDTDSDKNNKDQNGTDDNTNTTEDGMENAVDDVTQGAGDAVDDVTQGAGDAVEGITDGAKDAVDGAVNGAKNAVDDMTR